MQELALLMVSDCADAQEPEFAHLVRQAKAGDAAAFEAILCQFERRVLLTAMRLLGKTPPVTPGAPGSGPPRLMK